MKIYMNEDQLMQQGARLRDGLTVVHYASKDNTNYPHTSCGKTGIAIVKTDNKNNVTCSRCLKTMDRIHGER